MASRVSSVAGASGLALSGSLFAFTNVMVAPLLVQFERAFHRGVAFGAIIFAVSLAVGGGATPVLSALGVRLGMKRVTLTVIAAFVGASVVIGLSRSPGAVVAARGVQGLSGGLLPLSYGLVRVVADAEIGRRQVAALLSGCVGGAGGAGLVAVGLSVRDYRTVALAWWLGAGLVAFALVAVFVPGDRRSARGDSNQAWADVTVLSTAVLGVLGVLLLQGWSEIRIALAAVAMVALAVGGVRGVRSRLLKARAGSAGSASEDVLRVNAVNVAGMVSFFGLFILLPQWAGLKGWLGLGVLGTGILLAIPSGASFIGSRVSGRLVTIPYWPEYRIVRCGSGLAALGLICIALTRGNSIGLSLGLIPVGLGSGAAFNGLVEVVSKWHSAVAHTGVLVAGRYVGGALGSAVSVLALGTGNSGGLALGALSFTAMEVLAIALCPTVKRRPNPLVAVGGETGYVVAARRAKGLD